MSDRAAYLSAAIRLYLELPGAPRRASRSDWAIAATLYARAVPLQTLAHVFRLATLRRLHSGQRPESVHSLAYYRRALDHLTPDALEPGYVDYIARSYNALLASLHHPPKHDALSHRQNRAVSDRR